MTDSPISNRDSSLIPVALLQMVSRALVDTGQDILGILRMHGVYRLMLDSFA